MRKRRSLIVVIPVGPTEEPDFLLDTLDSVLHYTTPSRRVILIDDSGNNTCGNIPVSALDVDVLQTPMACGARGGLYYAISMGLTHAAKNYDFDVVLKLDIDGLIIGPHPESDAIEFFGQNPQAGLIGSYQVDCNGERRDFSMWPAVFARETGPEGLREDADRCILLRSLLSPAVANGYEPGEHCQGGAYFMSAVAIHRLIKSNRLLRKELCWSILGEDVIFGLLVKSIGMDLGDLCTGDRPMAVRWRGLPASPHDLLLSGKKVTHSTRFWMGMNEKEIREIFRKARNLETGRAM